MKGQNGGINFSMDKIIGLPMKKVRMETTSWGLLAGNGLVAHGKAKTIAQVQIHIERVLSIRQRLVRLLSLSHLYNMLYFVTFLLVPGALLGEFL